MRLVHQPVQPAGAIEQRIPGVHVKMNKVRVRHGDNLTFHGQDTKTQSFGKLWNYQEVIPFRNPGSAAVPAESCPEKLACETRRRDASAPRSAPRVSRRIFPSK
jgi:hypothetical protein